MNHLSEYLPYLVPPLFGGLIGYVTNHIAIRMLFRPLKPWHFLGVRIPLTPGIIPSKRGELALRMGEMVGDHLMTAEDVARTLEKEEIRRELRRTVGDKVERFLQRDLGSLASLIPDAYQRRFQDILILVQGKLQQQVGNFLGSDQFERLLRNYLRTQADELLSNNLAGLLPAKRRHKVLVQVDAKLAEFLGSDQLAKEDGGYVDRLSDRLLSSRTPIAELLPRELVEISLTQLENELPALLEKFAGLLYDPDFRKRMIDRGRQAIDGFLDSLGGLSGLLAGFIDLEKIYGKLPEFLDRAGEEVAAWLREEQTQQQIAQLIRQRVELFLQRSPAELLEKISYEKVSGVRGFLRDQVVAQLQGDKTREFLVGLLETGSERISDRSFASLLDNLLPQGGRTQFVQQIAEQILQRIRSKQAQDGTGMLIVQQTDFWLCQKSLGRLAERLPSDLQAEIQSALFQMFEELLKKEAPKLVNTLNVKQMVEEKVNGLDLMQVEGLLMGIMKEQFKYINLFGGLLGFIIGLFNLFVLKLF